MLYQKDVRSVFHGPDARIMKKPVVTDLLALVTRNNEIHFSHVLDTLVQFLRSDCKYNCCM